LAGFYRNKTARPVLWIHEKDLEWEERRKARAKKLDEQGPGPEVYYGQWVPDYLSEDRRGKGGVNGRNVGYLRSMTIENARGVKIGRAEVGTPVPGQDAKKMKKPSRVHLAKIEHEHGPLVPPDKSVHTVATGDVGARLDQQEWEELGYAKRVAPKKVD
jgi:hypothetical protein